MPQTEPSLTTMLLAAKQGDQAAFEHLLQAYTPLLDAQATAFANGEDTLDERDDMRQEACIAFFKAVMDFDEADGRITFGAFAKLCIRNHLISCRRKKRIRHASLTETDLDETALAPDPAQILVEEENYRTLYRQIEQSLSAYENRIWWLYLSGRTAKEIALQLRTNERSVQNAIYRIRKKLRATIPNP